MINWRIAGLITSWPTMIKVPTLWDYHYWSRRQGNGFWVQGWKARGVITSRLVHCVRSCEWHYHQLVTKSGQLYFVDIQIGWRWFFATMHLFLIGETLASKRVKIHHCGCCKCLLTAVVMPIVWKLIWHYDLLDYLVYLETNHQQV